MLVDSAFLLALKNYPDTRRQSFQAEEVSQGTHEAWLRGVLADHRRRLYIATERGLAVGSGRIDLLPPYGQEGELSLTVHWDHQMRGIGTALIEALCREAVALGVKVAVAHITESNTGSRIAFGRAGFAIEVIQDGVVTMLRRFT